jgi:hypothetical protein
MVVLTQRWSDGFCPGPGTERMALSYHREDGYVSCRPLDAGARHLTP